MRLGEIPECCKAFQARDLIFFCGPPSGCFSSENPSFWRLFWCLSETFFQKRFGDSKKPFTFAAPIGKKTFFNQPKKWESSSGKSAAIARYLHSKAPRSSRPNASFSVKYRRQWKLFFKKVWRFKIPHYICSPFRKKRDCKCSLMVMFSARKV